MTKTKLRKFVQIRNVSGMHTNLQFSIDAHRCGFEMGALGPVLKFTLDSFTGYEWRVPIDGGEPIRMVEFGRRLHLEGDSESVEMFALMPRAEYATAT